MAIITLKDEDFKQLEKFEVKCKVCGSSNCQIEIDYASYPSCSWNNITVICRNCHED